MSAHAPQRSTAALVALARARAFELYEGRLTPHRSCGVAIAETFGRPHAAYQGLRKGGITGCGECGALVAGRLVLAELLGDPSPTAAVTAPLRAAMVEYERLIRARFAASSGPAGSAAAANPGLEPTQSIICNDLTGAFADFASRERAERCTDLAALVAEAVAEVALRHAGHPQITPLVGGSQQHEVTS